MQLLSKQTSKKYKQNKSNGIKISVKLNESFIRQTKKLFFIIANFVYAQKYPTNNVRYYQCRYHTFPSEFFLSTDKLRTKDATCR